MLNRGSITVNSRKKYDRIRAAAKKEGRKVYMEIFCDSTHFYYWVFYEVKQ